MNNRVPDVGGASNDATEVDVDANVEVTVNGRTLDSPAIESKHWTSQGKSDFVVEQEMIDDPDGSLVDQLETQIKAEDVDDEIVVVFPEEYDTRLGQMGLKQEVRTQVDSRVDRDYTLEFTTYSELR